MKQHWLLCETATSWQLIPLSAPSESVELKITAFSAPVELAAAVAEKFKQLNISQIELSLVLEGQRFLTATFSHPGGRARQRQALMYLFEEYIPSAAEELVCDFIIFKHEALGIACEFVQLKPLVDAFSEQGITLHRILPKPILALQQLVRSQAITDAELVFWNDEDLIHAFVLVNGRPLVWQSVPCEIDAVAREYQILRQTWPRIERCLFVNLAIDTFEALRSGQIVGENVSSSSMLELAPLAMVRLVEGKDESLVELNRPPLTSIDGAQPLRSRAEGLITLSFGVLLTCLTLCFWIRAAQYDRNANALQRQQESIFVELFPSQQLPQGIRMRLESEYRKLAGVTGQLQGMPRIASALGTLHQALTSLPTDLRFRVLEIRVEPDSVYMEGEVRQHADADQIATRLRSAGFDVTPPHTERLAEQGVAYTINGRLPISLSDARGGRP
jgi:hypothetical protein